MPDEQNQGSVQEQEAAAGAQEAVPYMSHSVGEFPYFGHVDERGIYKPPAFYVPADKVAEFDETVAAYEQQYHEKSGQLKEQLKALEKEYYEKREALEKEFSERRQPLAADYSNLQEQAMEAVLALNPDVANAVKYKRMLYHKQAREEEAAANAAVMDEVEQGQGAGVEADEENSGGGGEEEGND